MIILINYLTTKYNDEYKSLEDSGYFIASNYDNLLKYYIVNKERIDEFSIKIKEVLVSIHNYIRITGRKLEFSETFSYKIN